MNILDCTLRDGGYYNSWDFDKEIVIDYLKAISLSRIEFVELGLRNFKREKFVGPWAYTTDKYLESIDLPEGPKYGVMVDAKTILESKLCCEDAIDRLFSSKNDSKISLVRVAAHFKEVEKCGPIINKLSDLGYMVGLNIMQAGHKSEEAILEAIAPIVDNKNLSVLYFADSLGNMDSNEVIRIIKTIRKQWDGDLGIHTHDNMDMGLNNSITALNNGVTWLDSTVRGMGRGAGNTQTEKLITRLNPLLKNKYDPSAIYSLVLAKFNSLADAYGWGSNILYFISAQNFIHPTYVQDMLEDKKISHLERLSAINYLSESKDSASYSKEKYHSAFNHDLRQSFNEGEDNIENYFDNKDILLIANGPSYERYKNDIKRLIDTNDFIVISLNILDSMTNVDYVVTSHNSKFLSDSQKLKKIKNKLIIPLNRFDKNEKRLIKSKNKLDVSFTLGSENRNKGNSIMSKYDLTLSYILGILAQSKLNKLYFVGFDGYSDAMDNRHIEMINVLDEYKVYLNTEIISLTPTSYPLKAMSLYALI